jgi:hypothetical protein
MRESDFELVENITKQKSPEFQGFFVFWRSGIKAIARPISNNENHTTN